MEDHCICHSWATESIPIMLLSGHHPLCPQCTKEAIAQGALHLIQDILAGDPEAWDKGGLLTGKPETMLYLSARDMEILLESLENPPEATENQKQWVRWYRDQTSSMEMILYEALQEMVEYMEMLDENEFDAEEHPLKKAYPALKLMEQRLKK